MRVKIQADVSSEDGVYSPGQIADIRDALAHQYIKNQWAVDPAGEVFLAADGTLKFEPKAKIERAVIETPEDNVAVEDRETETIKYTRRRRV